MFTENLTKNTDGKVISRSVEPGSRLTVPIVDDQLLRETPG